MEVSHPGSLVGGLSWLALSGLFALWTKISDSYSKTYGTLAAPSSSAALERQK